MELYNTKSQLGKQIAEKRRVLRELYGGMMTLTDLSRELGYHRINIISLRKTGEAKASPVLTTTDYCPASSFELEKGEGKTPSPDSFAQMGNVVIDCAQLVPVRFSENLSDCKNQVLPFIHICILLMPRLQTAAGRFHGPLASPASVSRSTGSFR